MDLGLNSDAYLVSLFVLCIDLVKRLLLIRRNGKLKPGEGTLIKTNKVEIQEDVASTR